MPEYNGYSIALIEEAHCAGSRRSSASTEKKMKALATGETFAIWKCPHATANGRGRDR